MSQSTDAVLFYGIPLSDGQEDELDFPEGCSDYYDVNEDWKQLKAPKQPPEGDGKYNGAEWDAWREANREYKKSSLCIEISIHCSDSYPMYYVHGREFIAYRGDVNEINPAILVASPEEDANIKEFCERYGIHYQQPKWYLASYYG